MYMTLNPISRTKSVPNWGNCSICGAEGIDDECPVVGPCPLGLSVSAPNYTPALAVDG
jgi:hypothetical protein